LNDIIKPYLDDKIIEQFDELLIEAWSAALNNKYDEAEKSCRQFIQHFNQLDFDDGISYKSFHNSLEWATASMFYTYDNQPPSLLGNYEDVEWLQIQISNIYHILGFCLKKKGQLDKAALALQNALHWNPLGADHYFELASIYSRDQSLLSLALEYYKLGLENACTVPSFAIGYEGLGFLLMEMDDLEGAKAAFEKSLTYISENKLALNQLFYLEEILSASDSRVDLKIVQPRDELGINLEGPLPDLDEKLINNGSPIPPMDTLLMERDIPVSIHSKFANGYALLGSIYGKNEKSLDKALELLHSAIKIYDKCPAAHIGLVEVYTRLGEKELANKHLTIFQELTDDSSA